MKHSTDSYMKLKRKQLFLKFFLLFVCLIGNLSNYSKWFKVTEFINNAINVYCWPIDIEIHSVLAGLLGKNVVPCTNYRPSLVK